MKISKNKRDPEVILVFTDEYLSHIQGKLLTMVEAAGFRENQEKAWKDMVREAIWGDAQDNYCTPVSQEDYKEFADKHIPSSWEAKYDNRK